jgi:hypothetical protein
MASCTPQELSPAEPSSVAPGGEPARVRFVSHRVERAPTGRCRADVVLARPGGAEFTGTAVGQSVALGDLRITAEATLDALHRAGARHRFELLGLKAVRAFDETVVLVQVAVVGGGGPPRLVGAAMYTEDHSRAAVLAVLNATNRVLLRPDA